MNVETARVIELARNIAFCEHPTNERHAEATCARCGAFRTASGRWVRSALGWQLESALAAFDKSLTDNPLRQTIFAGLDDKLDRVLEALKAPR